MSSVSGEDHMLNESRRSPNLNGVPLNLSLNPILNTYRSEVQTVLCEGKKFVSNSRVDVLTVSGPKSETDYRRDQDDSQVQAILDSLKLDADDPTLVALCIKLEENSSATYKFTPSISKTLLTHLFNDYNINSNFLLDLFGRPNYWSAVSQRKYDTAKKREIFEFHCQQPRWHHSEWYDKERTGDTTASECNKAPCSVYMSYSETTDASIYLIVAPDEDIWFSFIGLIQLGSVPVNNQLVTGHDLAKSPFLIHAMVSNIGLEKAAKHITETQDLLMDQLRRVDKYTESLKMSEKKNRDTHDSDSREMLSSITRELHYVSQLLDIGLARSRSAVKLSAKLLQSHEQFCHQTGRERLGRAASQTQAAIQYIHDSYVCQHSWLEQFKARKETAMQLVFNMVTQGDSAINLRTSYRMSQDSASIYAITVLAMVFVPGNFTAALFSCVAFRATESGAMEITDWLLPFILITVILTLTVITLWLSHERIQGFYHAVARRLQKQTARSRRVLNAMP
ncbi:uncharacterized protein FOBCDRAFT_207941 [Fusarium oxysporum Fo47]|uniref:uncharacterized protein n=1 Tax=Fusarium oxysporum Fo47 TaxID=660027 RepID=UPI002869C60A|nr:uncharacterized protein FOBCDRAFT_207941 [Fusarium oxysporum Fo47]WJG37070.1 hypothetical protein FOBCDRAFT_207941 [Fusarium oxysporum Fo47]